MTDQRTPEMTSESFFTDDSMIRRVIREWVVAFSGPRALLLQAAHPVAFAGFFAHTGSLADPYARLRRTAQVMDLIAWGDRDRAERACRRVRGLHRQVRGVTNEAAGPFPAGTPYAADDPELLLWVLGSLVDSAVLVYEKYVGSLTGEEKDLLWEDYKVVGRLFGLRDEDMPEDFAAFAAYVEGMLTSGELVVTDEARELAIEIVMNPPVPTLARPVLEVVNQVTIGLLPVSVRRQYGFSWDPLRSLALAGGGEYAKRLLVPLAPEKLRFIPQARQAA
jgi:uncharacterized protein (DUF2236 family)